MGDLTITAVSEALKLHYLESFRYQLNDEASMFLAELEKGSEEVFGSKIVMPLRYGRSGGIGNRADDGTLPVPNSRKSKQAEWETKNIFARFRLSEKVIAASRSNVGAFANMLEQEIEDIQTDAKLNLSRQVLGDGSGVMAKLTADVTLNSNASAGDTITVTVDDTLYLAEGMIVDIVANNGTQVSAGSIGVEISAVLSDTQFTYVTSDTVTTSEKPVDTNVVVTSGSYNKELTGLDAVIAEGTTLYGINRSQAEWKWLNGRLKNIGGLISDVNIQFAIDEVERTTGSKINFLMASYGVRRAYQNLLQAMKQFPNTLELKGGFKTMTYSGGDQPIPFVADKYVKGGRLYCLDKNDWKMYQMADWGFLDRDGAVLARTPNKAMWEGTLYKFCDMGCQRPRGQFLLSGITED